MFGENSLPGSPEKGEVSPYSDTALLATDIDLAKEEPMDVNTFKKMYLSDKEQKQVEPDENPWRAKYLSWVRAEARKEARATTRVEKLQTENVEVKIWCQIFTFSCVRHHWNTNGQHYTALSNQDLIM